MDDNVLNDGEPIVMVPVVKTAKKRTNRSDKNKPVVGSLPDSNIIPEIGCYIMGDESVVKLPEYATENAACFDVFTYLDIESDVVVYTDRNHKKPRKPLMLRNNDGDMELSFVLNPGDRALVPTGIVFAIPDGYSIRLHPRSGLSLKYFIGLANSEGVIDDDYINQTYALLSNESEKQFIIRLGDRLCQGELYKNQQSTFKQIKTQPIKKTNRAGGIGSTGTK